MDVRLIPIIEISSYCDEIQTPDGPYWKYPDTWESYYSDCNKLVGYTEPLKAYYPGLPFYLLTEISDKNLANLIQRHTFQDNQNEIDREQICPFFGGYVLSIDGEDCFFPQCCGDLSDIYYYEGLLKGETSTFYQGHPAPKVNKTGNQLIFDFSVGEHDESFIPLPPRDKVSIQKDELKRAIEKAKQELVLFSQRLNWINEKEQLNFKNIDNLLVWGEENS